MQLTPYLLPLATSAILPCGLALFALRRPNAAGAKAFVCLMLAVAAWSVAYMVELTAPTFETQVAWHRWTYVVGDLVPPTWLIFAARYAAGSGPSLVRGKRLLLLAVVPLTTLTLTLTNDPLNLTWLSFWPEQTATFVAVHAEPGPWFWTDLAASYVIVVAAIGLLAWSLFRSRRLYRQQIAMFLIGILVPWAADLATAFGAGPFPELDLTPMACTATAMVFAWGLFRFHFLDVMPIARDVVFEGLSDAVVVLDAMHRVVDLNKAAERVLGIAGSAATGHTAEEVLATWPRLAEAISSDSETRLEVETDERSFDARISPLRKAKRGGSAGKLIVLRDITDRKRLELRLVQQAFQDALTGLANRARFHDRLSQALQECAPAVLFLDLDDFKTVNDTLGHAAGDALLIQVARAVQACLGPNDMAARLGGDEFAILVPEAADAEPLAQSVLEALRTPLLVAGRQIGVRTSIGIAVRAASDAHPDDLLRKADLALYAAKAAGKSRLAVFDSSMERAALDRLELESDMRRGLQDNEFHVVYQPIVNVADSTIVELEALLRWQHPERGLIAPTTFIPLAERTGLIVPLGQFVLASACQQVSQWQRTIAPAANVSVSVNLSARQFQDPDLFTDVEQALRNAGLQPGLLRLEITETAAMQDADSTARTLDRLKQLGVRVAIDDFGTGYSSLSYLKRFPVDTLKIDRSFVDGLGEDHQDTAIVRSIVALARSLGLSTTAEGVETELQRHHIASLGCDRAQGYLFSRPVPADQVPALLTTAIRHLAQAA